MLVEKFGGMPMHAAPVSEEECREYLGGMLLHHQHPGGMLHIATRVLSTPSYRAASHATAPPSTSPYYGHHLEAHPLVSSVNDIVAAAAPQDLTSVA